MSRRSRRETKKKKDRLGKILVGVAVVALIGIVAWGELSGGPDLDTDQCPEEERKLAGQVAVLLDPSDALSGIQRLSGVPRLMEALQTLPKLTEIKVYTVGRAGRQQNLSYEYRVCALPHPDSIGFIEGFWTNRDIAARRYEERFVNPLRAVLDARLDVAGDTISPILEALQTVVLDAFQPRNSSLPRRLFVVSDVVQNSSNLSFFPDGQAVDLAAFSRQPQYGRLKVDLSRVDVTVFLLARAGNAGRIQRARLQDFWRDYFIDNGAAKVDFVGVEG